MGLILALPKPSSSALSTPPTLLAVSGCYCYWLIIDKPYGCFLGSLRSTLILRILLQSAFPVTFDFQEQNLRPNPLSPLLLTYSILRMGLSARNFCHPWSEILPPCLSSSSLCKSTSSGYRYVRGKPLSESLRLPRIWQRMPISIP